MLKRTLLSCAVMGLVFGNSFAAAGQGSRPDFSGTWKKDNAHSLPVRPGTVVLRVVHHDPDLTVDQTVTPPSGGERHASQHYTTDGKVSSSVGADGDGLDTAVAWHGSVLDFTVEEHEDGKILRSTETWSLSPDGATLTRVRHTEKGDQTVVYVRMLPSAT